MLAKKAPGNKASEFVKTFLFAKVPVQKQHELSTAGKPDTSVEENKMFIQRRFQYQPLIPQERLSFLLNEITSRNRDPPQGTHTTFQPTINRPKINGDCHCCGKKDRKSESTF